MAHTLYVIGIGPGHPDYMVPRGKQIIDRVPILVGSERALGDFAKASHETKAITGRLQETARFIEDHLQTADIAVLVSGDTGYYSLLPYLKKTFNHVPMEVVPGISSVTFAFARLGEAWQDARLISFHGRLPKEDQLVYQAGQKLGCLTDKTYNAARIAQELMGRGWPKTVKAVAFERLSYEDEHCQEGTLADMVQWTGFTHAVVVILG